MKNEDILSAGLIWIGLSADHRRTKKLSKDIAVNCPTNYGSSKTLPQLNHALLEFLVWP